MFIVASTEPSPKPRTTSATSSSATFGAQPVATRASGTTGPITRSTGRLPRRSASDPATTLPIPAMMGTRPTMRPSAPSESSNLFCTAGTRDTRAAKHSPWPT